MSKMGIFKGPAGYAIAIGAGGLLIYLLYKGLAKGAAAAANAVSNVNAGTPYAGAGVVGTVGNATNSLSGGVLAQFGSGLGNWLYDLTHAAYDPNAVPADANTPPPFATGVTSPQGSNPTILPSSYKSAVIDVPSLLTDPNLATPPQYLQAPSIYSVDPYSGNILITPAAA